MKSYEKINSPSASLVLIPDGVPLSTEAQIAQLVMLRTAIDHDIMGLKGAHAESIEMNISINGYTSGTGSRFDVGSKITWCTKFASPIALDVMVKNIVLQLNNEVLKINNQIRGLQLDELNLSEDE